MSAEKRSPAGPGTALILGATSDIGRAIARQLAADGWCLQLAARNADRLRREAADIGARTGAPVQTLLFEALAQGGDRDWPNGLAALPDLAVCVVGGPGDQAESESDPGAAARVMRTNYEAPALTLGVLAARFAERGSGVLVGVSSVAGERGRAANYVYGSAKAGLSAFLSGLRARLSGTGVHVVTAKPGFVRTRMTAGMALPAPLTATPEQVAKAVLLAVRRRRDVIYSPPIWRLIMLAVGAIPERLFKHLRL